MKKLFIILMLVLPIAALAQKKETIKVKISGFVTAETFVDTRKTVNSREGDVLLYPALKILDDNGKDINKRAELFMTAIHSRLNVGVTGFHAFGAKGAAVIQGDFIGTSTDKTGLLRLRHAFIKLDWDRNQLIAGKYWHPMFVTTCFPRVLNWGAAVPFHVLSRAPQLRFSHQFKGGRWLIAALSEMDFKSTGPDGANVKYVQQAAIPELSGQIQLNVGEKVTVGATAGCKFLKPYITNGKENKTDELLTSLQMNAWMSFKTPKLTWNLQGIYGQNMYNFVMLGGYGVSKVKSNGDYEYSNIKTSSVWTDVYTTTRNVRYGFFAGYTKNMGSDDKLVQVFSRGSNIDYAYQFGPRAEWYSGKFMIGAQALYTAAAYGIANEYAKVKNASEVGNIRLLLHLKYNF